MVCALVIGIFAWSAESGFLELTSPRAEDSYYNLLVQGFRAGQLNVKREAPPGLARLADPYDPAVNASYVWDARYLSYEMSYYKGKLYLYFGVTPALVLFWPYVALTGHYLLAQRCGRDFFCVGLPGCCGSITCGLAALLSRSKYLGGDGRHTHTGLGHRHAGSFIAAVMFMKLR